MEDRRRLYNACKYEATEYQADHGMNTAELYGVVTGRAKDVAGTPVTVEMSTFWKNMVLDDYARRA